MDPSHALRPERSWPSRLLRAPSLLLAGLLAACDQPEDPELRAVPGIYRFEEVAPGVFHGTETEELTAVSNVVVIVDRDEVVLIDSPATPAAARALRSQIRAMTPKPVRTVVNTHFHFDHVHGNQEFADSAEIIGHVNQRPRLVAGASLYHRGYLGYLDHLRRRFAALGGAEGAAAAGASSEPARLARLLHDVGEIRPVAPATTFSDRLTLPSTTREIRLLHLGLGHTEGDVVVHLPRERVLVVGDLLAHRVPYLGDAYFPEWIETLDALAELEFDVVLPGHGPPIRDRARIAHLQAFLRDFLAAGLAAYRAGLDPREAARSIDLGAHAAHFPDLAGPGVHQHAVRRLYEVAPSLIATGRSLPDS